MLDLVIFLGLLYLIPAVIFRMCLLHGVGNLKVYRNACLLLALLAAYRWCLLSSGYFYSSHQEIYNLTDLLWARLQWTCQAALMLSVIGIYGYLAQ